MGIVPEKLNRKWQMAIATHKTKVRVEIRSEIAVSDRPAQALVYVNDQLVAEVIGEVELKPGADGGWYHCVTLRKKGDR